jgi:phage-related holin
MKYDFIDSYNVVVGVAIAILTAIFGTYWYLFAAYLGLNILDWLTGWYKAKKLKQESSAIGF